MKPTQNYTQLLLTALISVYKSPIYNPQPYATRLLLTVGIHRSIFETPKFPNQYFFSFKTHTSRTGSSLNRRLLLLFLTYSHYQTAKLIQLSPNCQFKYKSNLLPPKHISVLFSYRPFHLFQMLYSYHSIMNFHFNTHNFTVSVSFPFQKLCAVSPIRLPCHVHFFRAFMLFQILELEIYYLVY